MHCWSIEEPALPLRSVATHLFSPCCLLLRPHLCCLFGCRIDLAISSNDFVYIRWQTQQLPQDQLGCNQHPIFAAGSPCMQNLHEVNLSTRTLPGKADCLDTPLMVACQLLLVWHFEEAAFPFIYFVMAKSQRLAMASHLNAYRYQARLIS